MATPPKPWELKKTELATAPVESIITPSVSNEPQNGQSQAIGDMARMTSTVKNSAEGAET